MKPIRVLVVDDSVFMRQALVKLLSCEQVEVIDIARNGKEGVEKVVRLDPDVVTMDIEMPFMNGIDALKEIMKVHPVPVIMVSTLTSEGAEATLEALTHGAVDFITKKAAFRELDSLKDELLGKVISIGSNSLIKNQLIRKRLLMKAPQKPSVHDVTNKLKTAALHVKPYKITGKPEPAANKIEIIGIGISTGGPNSLQELVKSLPEDLSVPILIAQHMPAYFTKSLADRLNMLTNLTVKEAEHDEKVNPGTIYIAQGGKHLTVRRNNRLAISEEPRDQLYKPSVDVLLESIAGVYFDRALGIIMTGMGHDGTEGMRKLLKMGGYSIAQEPESCVISGMPKSIIDAGLADEIHSLANLGSRITELCRKVY